MNKVLRVILNILIVIASIALLVCVIDLIGSIRYANREVEDPAETYAGVFEYKLEHRAYGEIIGDYYVERMHSFSAPAGYEDLYRIGEYAHTAFMSRVCAEKGDSGKEASYKEKAKAIGKELGTYEYTAAEIEGMLDKAP